MRKLPPEIKFYPSGLVHNPEDKDEIELWGHDAGEFAPQETPKPPIVQTESTNQNPGIQQGE